MKNRSSAIVIAWLTASLYYFFQYVMRSSPGAMAPQLSQAFGISTAGVASLAGLFYYGYAPFSLISGPAVDRYGVKAVIPVGACMAGVGALLFGAGNLPVAQAGRFLQGAGAVFALIGAVSILARYFSAERAATLLGATQMFGSSGGSVGQFVVGPIVAGGIAWNHFWIGMGIAGLAMGALLYMVLPEPEPAKHRSGWARDAASALGKVFRNPQSLLCGLIAGLLFVPTTVFDMIWGVRFLQDAHGFDYGSAVLRSSTVPLGWIVGSPLLGAISDRLGRRKPVIVAGACALAACLGWILFGDPGVLPPYIVGFLAGVSSGSAMVLYTVIKEANPPQFSGTATGVISFLNFLFSAIVGEILGWVMQSVSGGRELALEHYRTTFQPLLVGVVLAAALAFLLKETGPAARVREKAEELI